MPSTSVSTTSPSIRNSCGVRPIPTPSGVPVAMMSPASSVSPFESHSMIDVDREDHVRRGRVLLGDAVHAKLQLLGLRVAEFVGGDDDRTHRAEAVQALSLEPLHVLLLQVARADIVDDGVAEHVLSASLFEMLRPVLPMTAPSSASQSTCCVTARSTGMSSNGPVTVVGALVKMTGKRRDLDFLSPRACRFLRVRDVVASQAEDVLRRPWNRRMPANRRRSGAGRRPARSTSRASAATRPVPAGSDRAGSLADASRQREASRCRSCDPTNDTQTRNDIGRKRERGVFHGVSGEKWNVRVLTLALRRVYSGHF